MYPWFVYKLCCRHGYKAIGVREGRLTVFPNMAARLVEWAGNELYSTMDVEEVN